MPKTLEGYSSVHSTVATLFRCSSSIYPRQEVGRAGRDGLDSTCVLFLCPEDIPVLEGFCRGDTCSQTSLELWLGEVLLKEPEPDGALSFNHYEQGRLYDIRVSVKNVCIMGSRCRLSLYRFLTQTNTLGLLYAELELQLELIRAVTPFYGVYNFSPRSPQANEAINQDSSPSAAAVRRAMRYKGSGYEVVSPYSGVRSSGAQVIYCAFHISDRCGGECFRGLSSGSTRTTNKSMGIGGAY